MANRERLESLKMERTQFYPIGQQKTAVLKKLAACIFILGALFSCKKMEDSNLQNNLNSHIKYFGFTIIDTYWDDPTDSDTKVNYADEVHSFTNLADILVLAPTDDLSERLEYFKNLELKAVVHLNELFFELVDTESPSGANYNLRSDYMERWAEFKRTNQSVLHPTYIGALYIGEEPTWNGITYSELSNVAQLLKSETPLLPLMVIEAYPSLNDFQVPEQVDWIGFDRYFIKNPLNNAEFQKDWETLKSKLSNPSQKILVVMDTHYISWAHGDLGNIDLYEMDDVANNYYQLAKSDETVVGILGYFWPNGFDFPESIGARGMPENVIMEYKRIGFEITEKNN